MKSVTHEDTEENNDYSVDPLADPRLDKFDLYNMVDSSERDAIMNANPSFVVDGSDSVQAAPEAAVDSSSVTSDAGSGE